VWSASLSGGFNPRKELRYQLSRRLGGPQSQSGQLQKISPPTHRELIPGLFQPVVSHYIDYTILDMRAVDRLYYWLTLTILRNSNLTLYITLTFILYDNLLGRLSGVNR
jgi:hypothetical protein